MRDHQQTSAAIDQTLDRLLSAKNLHGAATERDKLRALQSLVAVLESALKVAYGRYYKAVPDAEPFPGACGDVLRQAIVAVEVARKAGLVQPR